jgi:hypothetical protein
MNSVLTIVPRFLRDPAAFFESVRRGEEIEAKSRSLAVSAVLFLAAYGFVMGLSHSFWQALSSAVKLPMLFVATIVFCLPAFYFFSLVLGTPLKMAQVTTVVLIGISVTAFLLLGLAPVMLFFVLTSKSYPFFQLLSVVFVAISGCIGVYFLWRGMSSVDPANERSPGNLRRTLLGLWFALYAFVGSQMTWRLSPLVGDPALPFILLRPSRDNFYMDVIHALEQAMGVQQSAWNADALPMLVGFSGICLIPLALLIFGVGVIAGRSKHSAIPSAPPVPVASASAAAR